MEQTISRRLVESIGYDEGEENQNRIVRVQDGMDEYLGKIG